MQGKLIPNTEENARITCMCTLFMLRQGRSAVQALQEVEVLTTDYVVEDILLTSADPGQRTTISPMTVQTIIRGGCTYAQET
ncbi:hypothetical protein NQZ68_000592 [Dissostichus eleginoides]|nr:hypothetical protein NQZ68_000592 [Dissostichus eleginoides]